MSARPSAVEMGRGREVHEAAPSPRAGRPTTHQTGETTDMGYPSYDKSPHTDLDVLDEVAVERQCQDEKWGEQNHPDGTGGGNSSAAAVGARLACQLAAQEGRLTWRDILREEVAEAFAETDHVKLRAELVQIAAVATAWVEAIDRRAEAAS